MNTNAALKLIGNQPTFAVRNMAVALSTLTTLNTPSDWIRLQAAVVWLRSKHQQVPHCARTALSSKGITA